MGYSIEEEKLLAFCEVRDRIHPRLMVFLGEGKLSSHAESFHPVLSEHLVIGWMVAPLKAGQWFGDARNQ